MQLMRRLTFDNFCQQNSIGKCSAKSFDDQFVVSSLQGMGELPVTTERGRGTHLKDSQSLLDDEAHRTFRVHSNLVFLGFSCVEGFRVGDFAVLLCHRGSKIVRGNLRLGSDLRVVSIEFLLWAKIRFPSNFSDA